MKNKDPFDLALDRFTAYLRDQRHVSPSTLRAYESDLGQFREFLAGEGRAPGPEEIDKLHVRGFVARMSR